MYLNFFLIIFFIVFKTFFLIIFFIVYIFLIIFFIVFKTLEITRVQSQLTLSNGCSISFDSFYSNSDPNRCGGAHVRPPKTRQNLHNICSPVISHEMTKLKFELSSSHLPPSSCFSHLLLLSSSIFCLPAAPHFHFTTYPTNPNSLLT